MSRDKPWARDAGHSGHMKPRADLVTIVGLGMLLMPLLTMWHEIGGHAAFCAIQGGHVSTIGAFYVECEGLTGARRVLMSCAGVLVNTALALAAYSVWQRSRSDFARLVLWLIWISEAFVAAGYLCFSGATGFGDLAPGSVNDGLGSVPLPMLWRGGELILGIALYVIIVKAGIRSLAAMLGNGQQTRIARRVIAHGYYATAGVAALITGLLNPVGAVITIMSAAASSFGGLAGFISLGFATRPDGEARAFAIDRSWPVFIAGVGVLLAFAWFLGPSLKF